MAGPLDDLKAQIKELRKALRELSNLTKFSKNQLMNYIKDKKTNYEILKGMANRDLSDLELLNRDYYQGRFASKNNKNKIVFNWDKESEF